MLLFCLPVKFSPERKKGAEEMNVVSLQAGDAHIKCDD